MFAFLPTSLGKGEHHTACRLVPSSWDAQGALQEPSTKAVCLALEEKLKQTLRSGSLHGFSPSDSSLRGSKELDRTEMTDHSIFFLFNLLIFNWRIIALQYCIGFYQTSTWISYRFNILSEMCCPSTAISHLRLWNALMSARSAGIFSILGIPNQNFSGILKAARYRKFYK